MRLGELPGKGEVEREAMYGSTNRDGYMYIVFLTKEYEAGRRAYGSTNR